MSIARTTPSPARRPAPADAPSLTIRPATAADAEALARLAALDSARPLDRPALVAEVDGVAVAALSLGDCRVVADPFSRTADVVALLEAHSTRLAAGTAAARGRTRRLPARQGPAGLRPA